MSEKILGIDTVLKGICLRYFYLIIISLSMSSVFYWYENLVPFNYLTLVGVVIHIFLIYIPYKLDYKSIEPLIPLYLIFLSFLLFPSVVFFLKLGQVKAIIWFLLIPFGIILFFSFKSLLYWCIFIVILIISSFFLSKLIPDQFVLQFTQRQLNIANIMSIIICLSFIYFFLHSINLVNKAKKEVLLHNMEQAIIDEKNDEDDFSKYNDLYNKILIYIEKEKPYCDSDFNISQLATAVESNVKYVSKAIKINKGVNFNLFINTYRINMIKEMLNKDHDSKNSNIRQIYVSCGFKHQSTFNKVFKQMEGITPSEYIKEHIS